MNKTTVISVMAGIAAFGAAVWAVRTYGKSVPVVGPALQKAADIVA